jgi:hypothetical protein
MTFTHGRYAEMRPLNQVFAALDRSSFRRRFRLGPKERSYLAAKGIETVLTHGRDFVAQRLAPANPDNDGRQTPVRGHPFFVAQHATATCCRSCLAKWHDIPTGMALDAPQQAHVLAAVQRWLQAQSGEGNASPGD